MKRVAIRVPSGPAKCDPARLLRPTLILQGEWDAVSPPSEGLWIFERLGTRLKRFVILSRGGHRLRLEASRLRLYREIERFLLGDDEGMW